MLFNIFILMTLLSITVNGFRRSMREPTVLHLSHQRKQLLQMSTSLSPNYASEFQSYLAAKAKVPSPQNLDLLLELLVHKGEIPVSPTKSRVGMNPLLIPITKNPVDNSLTCYLRWPTQKDGAPLQLVKTTETGVYLVSLDTDKYIHRLTVELDFAGSPDASKFAEKINKVGISYKIGDYLPMIKSGKFPTLTKEDLGLVLDRYVLTKVGPFPDAYERLAHNFLKTGSEVSAFVTCERAITLFYGWGHPMSFNALMIGSIKGRESEGRDAARAALSNPLWTVSKNQQELDKLAVLAGYTGSAILGKMHDFRAKDERKDEMGEGLSPAQVALDQAAHLMDAIAMNAIPGGWDTGKVLVAEKYVAGGYPEIADFILS